MFNNAGIGGTEGLIHETPEEVFDRILAVDLKAVWLGIKHAVPHLIAAGGGSIVNTASVSAHLGMKYQGAYGAAKGGVVQLTRVAAVEYAEHGIRANAICPGGVLTPLLWANPGLPEPLTPAVVEEQLKRVQPIARAGLPRDIARAAELRAGGDDAAAQVRRPEDRGGAAAGGPGRPRLRALTQWRAGLGGGERVAAGRACALTPRLRRTGWASGSVVSGPALRLAPARPPLRRRAS
jgi:NAD(P)-dependent dehydrogenase (short-subunit alcohol dehydrogenase family)